MKTKSIVSLVIVFVMVMAIFSGCGKTPADTTNTDNPPAQSSSDSGSSNDSGEFSYPVEGNVVLTYFGRLHKKVMSSYSSYADLPVVQKWFEETGVTLDFFTPAAGMETEQYNIMLASGDLTDIISYDMVGQTGGLQKLYKDNVIIKLTDLIDEQAPNLRAFYNENPHMERLVKDDNGDHYVFPFLKGGGVLLATTGPMLREDILNELGLDAPRTIEDWDTTLQAFKDNYPDASPFLSNWDNLTACFQPAYGVSNKLWYEDSNGKVHLAPLEEGYKEFLMQISDWYARGLIDKNFSVLDNSSIDNALSAGTALSTFGSGGSSLGAYMAANEENSDYSMIGVPTPTLDGSLAKYATEYEFGGNPQIAITSECENVEAAMRMYDWAFDKENQHLLNWGIEGESFVYDENGVEQYTEVITNNPDGLTMDAALALYATTHIKAPAALVQDPKYMLQYYSLPQQQQAMKAWEQKDYENRAFPPVSYTTEESSQLVSIMSDLETYVESMAYKFILGTEPISSYDEFINTINKMDAEKAIEIQQNAVDRFNAR